jgi:hydrogenase nickel incorporation protein HypA/HybF
MHERSLVAALLEQVVRVARVQRAASVRGVCLHVGELAGVEPVLVESAFHELKTAPVSPDCRLTLRHVPLTARCRSCAETVILERLHFQCPCCCSTSLDLIDGDTVRLESIEIEDESVPS